MDYYLARTFQDGTQTSHTKTCWVQKLTPYPYSQLEKYKKADFGRCPRVLCQSQPLLPCGLTDVPYEKAVKLYCPRCEDLYSPKSSRHGSIDGAYFGTTFPHMLLMGYPHMIPSKESRDSRRRDGEEDKGVPSGVGVGDQSTAAAALKAERYRPKIFGFGVHEISKWMRWQEAVRDKFVPLLYLIEILTDVSYRQIARLEEIESVSGPSP